MGFISYINQDCKVNKGNTKGMIIMILFRIASYFYKNRVLKIVGYPYMFFYKHFTQIFFSIELPYELSIGPGLKIYHGIALIVHEDTVIGKNCVLRQSTTIGNAHVGTKCPKIGDNVEVGCNVCIIGDVVVGNNAIIGAGSVIVKNVPQNSVVAGNPGKVIKTFQP
jgi:putative colanic acid biosynthesis acetyltransferase WcaB